MFLNIYIG